MLRRSLDVVLQYARPLALCLAAVPIIVAATGIALDHAQTVTVRVFAEDPSGLASPALLSQAYSASLSPAQREAALMTELVGTDSFLGEVLQGVYPGFREWTAARRERTLSQARASFQVVPEGSHVLDLSYAGGDPRQGAIFLSRLLATFGQTVQTLQASQTSAESNALQKDADRARQATEEAVGRAEAYRVAHNLSATDAFADPQYQSLANQAQLQIDGYVQALLAAEDASPYPAVPAPYHVIDPPATAPGSLSDYRRQLLAGLVSLGVVALIETILVYLLAKRDPRLRCAEEVRDELGVKLLGSVPALDRQ